MDIELPTKKIILNASSDVHDICAPLFRNSPIRFFRYAKVYSNGLYVTLSNHAGWLEHYFEHNYYQLAYFENNHSAWNEAPSAFIWTPLENCLLSDAREFYDIDNGITLIENSKKYCEFFHFASDRQGVQAVNFYLNNIDILKRFVAYFKLQASKLIETTQNKKIILPSFNSKNNHTFRNIEYATARNNFLAETSIKYRLADDKTNTEVQLSKQQMLCCFYAINGKKNKEIADYLNISSRTVESYFNVIKTKLNIYSKNQLKDVIPNYMLEHIELEIKSSDY